MGTKPKIKNIRAGKRLLQFLEETDYFERWHDLGLCVFIQHLHNQLHIDYAEYLQMRRFLYHNKPKHNKYGYWFQPGDKQARIDYLKKLLYDKRIS